MSPSGRHQTPATQRLPCRLEDRRTLPLLGWTGTPWRRRHQLRKPEEEDEEEPQQVFVTGHYAAVWQDAHQDKYRPQRRRMRSLHTLSTLIKASYPVSTLFIVQELCESRGGRPGLSVLTSLLVSVDVKNYWTMLRHWSHLVLNMSTDIWGH